MKSGDHAFIATSGWHKFTINCRAGHKTRFPKGVRCHWTTNQVRSWTFNHADERCLYSQLHDNILAQY